MSDISQLIETGLRTQKEGEKAFLQAAFTALFPDDSSNHNLFNAMLDTEAYESAALMMVPEDMHVNITRFKDHRSIAMIYQDTDYTKPFYKSGTTHNAWTPAIAIALACLFYQQRLEEIASSET